MAKVADTSYYEKVIEDNERTIAQLQRQLNKQLGPPIPPILEENSEEMEAPSKELEAQSKELEAQNSPIQSIDDLHTVKRQDENPEGSERNESKERDILQDLIDCMPAFEEREASSEHGPDVLDQLTVSQKSHSGFHSGASAPSYY